MNLSLQHWIKISVFNLLIVSAIGFAMRYKILYPLPFVDQKHLLHGHSHFAFAGWISQVLMVFLIKYLARQNGRDELKRYRWILWANLLTAYGMLIAFPIQGYQLISISFSTLSIFTSYAFAIIYWKDLNRLPVRPVAALWIKAALVFYALSSLGAFSLAYMMANKIAHLNWHLAAVYFFLHFQYNGWFFFACMGLLSAFLSVRVPFLPKQKMIFWFFALSCSPAYLLSALWLPIPKWLFVFVVAAAVLQAAAWFWLSGMLYKNRAASTHDLPNISKYLWCLAALALSIKILLQLGSTIPSLSTLAFGFRPIVIGYLHLVLLGVISMFLLGYIFSRKIFHLTRLLLAGCFVFSVGVILNELALMTQGIAAMGYHRIPYINQFLLGAAFILFTGIALILSGLKTRVDVPD